MYGATELTAVLGAVPASRTLDHDGYVHLTRAMAAAGLPVMLLRQGDKRPLDMRTEKEKDTGPGGVHLATTEAKTIKKYVDRVFKDPAAKRTKGHPAPLGLQARPNIGVRLGGSRYIVADADTPEEVQSLIHFLAPHYGGTEKVPGPTVTTPGTADGAHHGGGHWWFRIPEDVSLDRSVLPATVKVPGPDGVGDGFTLYVGDAYVVVPPSVRPEGPYTMVTSDNPVPPSLWSYVDHAATERGELVQRRLDYTERAGRGELGSMDEQVADWSAATPWEEVLAPAGWVNTEVPDSCGCDIWTAPGTHGSPKSATAHGVDCTEPRVDVLNPPIHVWTDNPGDAVAAWIAERGSKTLSKLTMWAILHHDGNMGRALEAAGIEGDPAGTVFGPDTLDPSGVSRSDALASAGVNRDNAVTSTGTAPAGERTVDMFRDAPVEAPVALNEDGTVWTPPREPLDLNADVATPSGLDMWEAWNVPAPADEEDAARMRRMWPPIGTLEQYRHRPPPRFLVADMLEDRGLLSIIGAPGVGKSAVALDMACCIATGTPWHGRRTLRRNVLYVAGEGVSGAVNRCYAWSRAHDNADIPTSLHIVEEPVQLASRPDVWAFIAFEARRRDCGVIIFDTLARMSAGMDENSATDMGMANSVFDRLRTTTGAAVLYVHHTARGTDHGRGSTALFGAVDSELIVQDTTVTGKPFATDGDNRPVDADGNPLPGKPLTVKVNKQKNGSDDAYTYVCLTSRYDSMVVTDLEGNAGTPSFGSAGSVEVGVATGEDLADTAERVTAWVGRFTSGEKLPTMADIARAVAPDRAHAGKVKAWRAVLDLAVDKALTDRHIYKVGAGFTVHPPLD